MTQFLVYISTKNDRNGNARRGWIRYQSMVVGSEGYTICAARAFYNEGSLSYGAIPQEYRKLPITEKLAVTPGQYREYMRRFPMGGDR